MEKLQKILRNAAHVFSALAIFVAVSLYAALILLIFGWLPAVKFWGLFFSIAELHPIIFLIGIGIIACICLATFIISVIVRWREEDKERYDRENDII